MYFFMVELTITVTSIISLCFAGISLALSLYLGISNKLKDKKGERRENFIKVFKKYNMRYQEYYERMREGYELINNNDFLLMLDEPDEFYPMKDIKVNLDKRESIEYGIVYNKHKFPYKKEDFLSNYRACYYEGRLRDEPSYFLINFEKTEGKAEFTFFKHGYNEYINSGTYLEYEIANSHNRAEKNFLKNRVDILDFSNRYVGVGICTLTIIKNIYNEDSKKNISYFLMHERNPLLAEHPGQKSVVPAGTLEPINKTDFSAPENYNIENTVYREFNEEVLGKEDFSALSSVELLDDDVIISKIRKASHTKYLGAGLDIMNGKLEIIGLLIIDADKMGAEFKKLTIEGFLTKIRCTPNAEGSIFTKKLTRPHLNQYMNNVSCAPVARQLCKVLVDHFDEPGLFE